MSIWEVQKETEKPIRFAQSSIIQGPIKIGYDGTDWAIMDIQLVPIEPNLKIQNWKSASFINTTWNDITLPSILKLVKGGKLTSFTDILNQQFVTYCLTDWKDRTKKSITYFKDSNPDRILKDDNGPYILKPAIEYLDVFASMDEWQIAYEVGAPPVVEAAAVSPQAQEPTMSQEQILASLETVVSVCGVNLTQLQSYIASPPYDAFAIDSQEIRTMIAKMVIEKCGSDAANQVKMFEEINIHFNQDAAPYMTVDSPEMMENAKEIVF